MCKVNQQVSYMNLLQLYCLLVLVSVFFSVWSRSVSAEGLPPTQVQVMQLSAQNVPVSIELPAVLIPSKEVEIRAQVPGRIQQIAFKDGQQVEKGQLLYALESDQLAAALAREKADRAALQARLDQANRNLRRVNALKSQRAIAQKDVDDAISAQAIAVADIQAAKARIQEAEVNLAYAQITAPVRGIVSRSAFSEGDYVQGAEDILLHLSQVQPMKARFNLPARAFERVKAAAEAGQMILLAQSEWKAVLKLSVDRFFDEVGRIEFLDIRVNSFTGSQEGIAVFANAKASLQPGQYLRIFVEGAYYPNAVAVPQSSVLDGSEGKFVYRYVKQEQGYVAQPQPVVVGEWVVINNSHYWIIQQGLVPDDQIIVSGHARIQGPMTPVQAAGPLQVQGKDGQALSEKSI